MKLFKKIIASLLVVLILLPILFYVSVVVTNNYIANRIEKNLTSYELPEDTKLIDSFSKAEKLSGNGNGMQYVGVILVESELSAGAIKAHYSQKFDFIEVNEQKNEEIRFDLKIDRTFKRSYILMLSVIFSNSNCYILPK